MRSGFDDPQFPAAIDVIYFEAAKNRYVGAVSLGYASDGKRLRSTGSRATIRGAGL